jgi:hypothetical protein
MTRASGCEGIEIIENKANSESPVVGTWYLVLGQKLQPLSRLIGIRLGQPTAKSFVYWDHWDE